MRILIGIFLLSAEMTAQRITYAIGIISTNSALFFDQSPMFPFLMFITKSQICRFIKHRFHAEIKPQGILKKLVYVRVSIVAWLLTFVGREAEIYRIMSFEFYNRMVVFFQCYRILIPLCKGLFTPSECLHEKLQILNLIHK